MVKLYSRDSCGPCRTLKYWLNKKGIKFEEHEPDESVWIVPTLIIGEHRIEGLNFNKLNEVLGL